MAIRYSTSSGGCLIPLIILGVIALVPFWIGSIFVPDNPVLAYILGAFLCVLFCVLMSKYFLHRFMNARQRDQHDFQESLLILCSDVVKADGHFKRSELECLRDCFVEIWGPARAQQALERFREIMDETNDIDYVCQTLRAKSSYHDRILIVQILFRLADADGELHSLELTEIQRIALSIGVSRTDYESLKAMFVGGHSYHAGPTPAHDVSNDYAILGISPDATDEEVKKAYRALAKKYHPDRVSHLGEDMKKQAEEKFNRLSDAYDNIKRSRGMK